MVSIPPNVVHLIFANRLLSDKEKHDISLIGIFQMKGFSSFPTAPVEMVVFTMLKEGRGEGLLELTVFALDAEGEYDADDWIYRKRKWVSLPKDPNVIMNARVETKSLR